MPIKVGNAFIRDAGPGVWVWWDEGCCSSLYKVYGDDPLARGIFFSSSGISSGS